MGTARCRIMVLGEVTQWARQYVSMLQTSGSFEFVFERSVDKFLESTQAGLPQIVLIENLPGSRKDLLKLRQSNRRLFLLWIGRNFTKEDLAFAIAHRIYGVFEDPKAEDSIVQRALKGAAHQTDATIQSEQILRSLKSLLLQHESEVDHPFLGELKTAIAKLESTITHNEFAGVVSEDQNPQVGSVPFHESQAFSDALITVHELERTGVLRVTGGAQQEGAVKFLQGKIISANTGGVMGIKALYRMFLWDDMRFVFSRKDVKNDAVQADLNGELQEICREGDSLRARFQKVRKEMPPSNLVLAMEPKWMQISTTLSDNQFATLATVIEFGQVGLVLDYNPLTDVDIVENLIGLKRSRAIKVVAVRAPLAL